MKHSFSFFRNFTLLAAVLFAPASAFASSADCPVSPTVSWWSGGTHESIISEVMDRHYGDWSSYIAEWEMQLDRMKDIHARGKKAFIKTGSSTVLIKNLPAYISKLERRIAVIHCLRGENKTASDNLVMSRKGDPERGEALSRTAGCFGCHGVHGVSNTIGVPNLAGQNDLYLFKQMKEFLVSHARGDPSGVFGRHNKIMDMKVARFKDEDIWNLVSFYSDLSCAPGGRRGGGDMPAPRKAVLCVECHGNKGYSVYREIPNLAGQSESYLFRQLKALRMSSKGPSRSTDSDQRYHLFMSQQVAILTNADISTLAKFYSDLTCR